ncbi:DmsC/YnfH family molybdoenzyme membrane anchor subunit [Silvibacterium dinghuense]|uniref:4Fe-4S ferredoxin n=1 Tax=Silvibacterium dinghuense TaxID=1560006 RepID=A0A4Q1SGE2_9BACT|nr:DmsC/YnfH family molybdoenzyme membrane anchor subunit [Silvibacterium dinghuense]RXS96574.1 4Fe-4S ferredoxin [Silvibacterium dinghuense]GGG91921.1 hypothetical protein GCM10011586_03180 [Silvibacterium dinghuense]
MGLPLYELAADSDSAELVRLTLTESGAVSVPPLIPMRPLEPGEQYRFHFDMTKCIGCRSCEIACNEQNGNPADIKWRRVGELEGGTYPDVMRTYLSMGCNHCLSADCLRGCPVDAYKKDPLTGIVLHSADACIGCQYCVWNCPYSVPQFNPERGVVGKCDMCRNRLLDDREPACVNACPENAIQIEIINKDEWRRDYAAAESPGMPPAGQTISTTRITLPAKRASAAWLDRVDTGAMVLEHAHGSLIVMTSAMQAAFGLLCALLLTHRTDAISLALLLGITIVAINTSIFHLGRPAYAWRALKMWRRSWLSREVLCFTLFLLALKASTLCAWIPILKLRALSQPLAFAAALIGLAGTLASARIYLVKARPAWNLIHTPIDFVLSSFLMAGPLAAILTVPVAWSFHELQALVLVWPELAPYIPAADLPGKVLSWHWIAMITALWLVNQMVRLIRLRASHNFEMRASFHHLRGEQLWWKVALSWIAAAQSTIFFVAGLHGLSLLAAVTAVMLNRYLFFVSVVPLSMGLTFMRPKMAHGEAA